MKKLDSYGIAHVLTAIVIVLTVAIGGTAYLVKSNALVPPVGGGSGSFPNFGCSVSAPQAVKHGHAFSVTLTCRNGNYYSLTPTIKWGAAQYTTTVEHYPALTLISFPTIPANSASSKTMSYTATTNTTYKLYEFAASYNNGSLYATTRSYEQ